MDIAREAVVKVLKNRNFTALICLNDELAVGAVAGLSEAGVRIPEDVAVASVGQYTVQPEYGSASYRL